MLHDAVILGVTRDGCLLTITVKIEVDGSYTLQVWDDQVLIGELPASGKAGEARWAIKYSDELRITKDEVVARRAIKRGCL